MAFKNLRKFAENRVDYDDSDKEKLSERSKAFLDSLIADLGNGESGFSGVLHTELLSSDDTEAEALPWAKPLLECSWGEGVRQVEHYYVANNYDKGLFGIPYNVIWTHIDYCGEDGTIQTSFSGTVRTAREEAVSALGVESGADAIDRLDENTVYFLTFDGPEYSFPDLMVAGPGPRDDTAGRFEEIGVQILELNDNFLGPDRGPDAVVRHIEDRLGKLAHETQWNETFGEALETRGATRNYFKSKMRKALSKVMALLAKTAGEPLEDEEGDYSKRDLEALHAASVLLAFRLVFLHELERRQLLYTDKPVGSQPKLDQYLDTILRNNPSRPGTWETGDFTRRILELSRMIVQGSDEVSLSGGSIFKNLPDEATFDLRTGELLDRLEDWFDADPNPDLARHWDEAIAETGELLVGRVSASNGDDEVGRLGSGGTRHTHRVLGDIYEQMLALIPDVRDDGTPVIREPTDDESSKQKELAAHYTPRDLVFEVVRPTLGHLFKQRWNDVDENVDAYLRELRNLKIVDPAMGSGHFLTAAALEIAREIAWTELFANPRPFWWHEPAENPNPLGEPPEDFEPAYIQETRAEFAPSFETDVTEDDFRRRVGLEIPGVVRRSIYGVDKNPLAVELGKLSLWLFSAVEVHTAHAGESKPEDRPDFEQFLDDNVKCGDSLVGLFLDGAPAAGLDHYDSVTKILHDAGLEDFNSANLLTWQNESFDDRVRKIRALRRALSAADDEITSIVDGSDALDVGSQASLREYADKTIDAATSYDYREAVNQACKALLDEIAWLYDLAVAVKYIGYTSGTYQRGTDDLKPERLAEIVLGEVPDGRLNDTIEKELTELLNSPFSGRGKEVRKRLRQWVNEHLIGQSDVRPFHWELEFSEVFNPVDGVPEYGGFDAVVANPPFIGDRDIRERLGGNENLVDYFANYFIPQKNKSEYAGLFFHRYTEILGSNGTLGSLGSNSIGQASNREYITKPLATGFTVDTTPLHIRRAAPNREWPGEASVHFAALIMTRQEFGLISEGDNTAVYVRSDAENGQRINAKTTRVISSYLDEYPDFEPAELLSNCPHLWTGCFLRGNFSIHREPGQSLEDAVKAVPESERDALAAYLNTDSVQQQPQPTPPDVVIDFLEPLMEAGLRRASASEQLNWLGKKYDTLLDHLRKRSPHAPDEPSVKETRSQTNDGRGHDKFWWSFGYGRTGLRKAWKHEERLATFSAVAKVWSPFYLPKKLEIGENGEKLRICPIHALFVAPKFDKEHMAVTCSFLFQILVRRESSSLKSDLRFTPTKILPYFPWPWKPEIADGELVVGKPENPHKQRLEIAGQHLLDVRTDLLENPRDHELSRDLIGGPTDLYNIYNRDIDGDTFAAALREEAERAAESQAIDELRRAHVELLQVVLDAYAHSARQEGDEELADRWANLAERASYDNWGIDHPWLDRSPRFVPEEPIRAELFELIDRHNSLRYQTELEMLADRVLDVLRQQKETQKQHWFAIKEDGLDIDRETSDLVLEYLYEKGVMARTGTSGNSKWWVKED